MLILCPLCFQRFWSFGHLGLCIAISVTVGLYLLILHMANTAWKQTQANGRSSPITLLGRTHTEYFAFRDLFLFLSIDPCFWVWTGRCFFWVPCVCEGVCAWLYTPLHVLDLLSPAGWAGEPHCAPGEDMLEQPVVVC